MTVGTRRTKTRSHISVGQRARKVCPGRAMLSRLCRIRRIKEETTTVDPRQATIPSKRSPSNYRQRNNLHQSTFRVSTGSPIRMRQEPSLKGRRPAARSGEDKIRIYPKVTLLSGKDWLYGGGVEARTHRTLHLREYAVCLSAIIVHHDDTCYVMTCHDMPLSLGFNTLGFF